MSFAARAEFLKTATPEELQSAANIQIGMMVAMLVIGFAVMVFYAMRKR